MRLSDLQAKDIIDIETGTKIGNIIDVIIDDNGLLSTLVIDKSKLFSFFSKNELMINWDQIKKIGEDVILVNLK